MNARTQRGVTLVELMTVVAVLVIVMMVTVPSFSGTLARMRLEGAGNELGVDLQYARSEAVQRGRDVMLQSGADGTRYTIMDGVTVVKTVDLPGGVTIEPVSTAVTFTPLRGMSAADVTFTLKSGSTPAQLSAVVLANGRLRLCAAVSGIPGYEPC